MAPTTRKDGPEPHVWRGPKSRHWRRARHSRAPVLSLALALALVTAIPAPADGGWLELKTEHFTFIYRPGGGAAGVAELIPMADGIYDRVRSRFGYDVPPATVIVYDQTDFANGYYFLAPPQHIGLFTVEPWVQFLGADGASWLEMLLVHELTHYFQYNTPAGLAYQAGRLAGSALGPFHHLFAASWTVEGNAVNNESDLTDGGRLQDPRFLADYRAQLYADAVPGLFQLGYDSHLPPRGRYYLGGAVFMDHLMQEHGEAILGDFHVRFARFPLGGVWLPLRASIGRPLRNAYTEMLSADAAAFGLESAGARSDRLTPARVGTWSRPRTTSAGVYVYRRSVDRAPGIVRIDPRTGSEDLVWAVTLTHPDAWSVSADGSQIVAGIATVRGSGVGLDAGERAALVLWERTSGRARTLVADDMWSPAISPDGREVAAVRREAGNTQVLVRFPVDSPEAAVIIGAAPGMTFFDPVYAPDGRSVFASTNQDGDQAIRAFGTEAGSDSQDSAFLPGRVLVAGGLLPDGTSILGLARPHFGPDGALRFVAAAGPGAQAINAPLAVWELSQDLRSARIAAWDPVAALSRTDYDGITLVQTVSELGSELRSQPRGPETSTVLPTSLALPSPLPQQVALAAAPDSSSAGAGDTRNGSSAEGHAPGGDGLPGARRYRHVPWPQFWLPDGGTSEAALAAGLDPLQALGAGIFVLGADQFGRTSWQASARYFPGIGQPAWNLAVDFVPGAWSLSLTTAGNYVPRAEGFAWLTEHSARVGVDLLRRADYRQSLVVGANAGVTLSRERASSSPFTFAQLGELAPDAWSVAPVFGIGGTRVSPAPRVAASGHLDRSATLSLSLLDLFSGSRSSAGILDGGARIDLAPGYGRHTLRFATSAGYGFGGVLAGPRSFRGFGTAVDPGPSAGSAGQFGLSLEWILPAWLVDIPFAPSSGITAFSAATFVQARGAYGSGGMSLEPDMVIGLELGAVINNFVELPLSCGVSVRLRPSAGEPVQGFAFYVGTGDTGLNLETGAARSRITTPAGWLADQLGTGLRGPRYPGAAFPGSD